jgi:hypothetical protein
MNIDERLEALTQTVELMASMQKETEKHMTALATKMERLAETDAQFHRGMEQISRILANHEHRPDSLEGNRPQ